MKRILLLALLAPGLALVGGCASQPPAYRTEDSARYLALDKGVEESVTCPALQEARLQDGRMQVTANLRNLLNRRIQVQANCLFKDAQGFVVEDTPFQNVFLDENAFEDVRFVSANDKAQRYTIRVRQAR
jgi:hypothetical protein